MGKRSQEEPDNLVMLLDTMCNLLAGLILIAILLAVVSQASAPAEQSPAVATGVGEADDTAKRIAELTEKINALSNRISGLRGGRPSSSPTGPGVEETLRTIHVLDDGTKAAKAKLAENTKELDKWLKEMERVRREMAEVERKTHEVRAPSAHVLTNSHGRAKRDVFVIVKNKSLFVAVDVSRPYRDGTDRGVDRASVEVKLLGVNAAGSPVVSVTPQEGHGQLLSEGAEKIGTLRNLLANVSPSEEYVNFVVYPDSYQEFNYVKSRVLSRKIDYNWVPMEDNEEIRVAVGGAGGAGASGAPPTGL